MHAEGMQMPHYGSGSIAIPDEYRYTLWCPAAGAFVDGETEVDVLKTRGILEDDGDVVSVEFTSHKQLRVKGDDEMCEVAVVAGPPSQPDSMQSQGSKLGSISAEQGWKDIVFGAEIEAVPPVTVPLVFIFICIFIFIFIIRKAGQLASL